MNNVGMFAALEHEFQCRAREKGKALVVVSLPVKHSAMEKIVVRMRLDKEAFASVNEAEINAAMDGVIVPGNPKVLVSDLQVEDLIVPHAIVLGQDDLDRVAPDLQFPAQAEHDVAQA